ncbi:MAG: DUF3987 domain-containing protein, partial [Bacteroidetes bacterium]|nr:DUF3987 domain-containing protein [Bacteroidota bacterium]
MAGNDLPLSGALITDGEIQRYSADHKRNQKDEWYIAHEGISESGKPYIICIYGSWSTGEKFEYRSWQYGDGFQPNQKDLDDIKRKVAELREKSHREKLINHQEASKRATLLWKKASAFPECEDHNAYLEKKKIQPKGDIRYGTYEYQNIPSLILPIRNVDGDLKSLQFIWVDEEGRTQKRFLSGGQKQECFMPLKPIEEAEEIYVCEGYATGISVQKATYRPVVVAFDSGNLESVVAEILKKYPHIRITIAADNDLDNPNNIGVKKAKEIQEKYGCSYTYPNTGDVLDGVTDFNDLEIAFGNPEVMRQLEDHEICKQLEEHFIDMGDDSDIEGPQETKPFPIEAFPENIRNYMEELAKKVQVSKELVATWMLPAMSTAVQNLRDVDMGSHTVPLSLFTLGVADSGERKTAIIKQVLKPYKKIEKHLNEEYEKSLKLFKAQHKNWEIQGKKKDAVDLV